MTVIYSGDLFAYMMPHICNHHSGRNARGYARGYKSLSNARGYKSLSNARGYEPLSILKLDDIIKLQTALFVHRHFNKKLPTILQTLILVTLLQLACKHVVSIITYLGIDLQNCNAQSNVKG